MSDSRTKVHSPGAFQPRPTPYFGATPTIPAGGGSVNHKALIPSHLTGVNAK